MMVLVGLLSLNAVLHGVIVGRFGVKGNEPPLAFGVVYAGLAVASWIGWSRAPVAVLIVTAIGLLGLAVNFKKLQREPTVEKIIFVVGAALLVTAGWLLTRGGSA